MNLSDIARMVTSFLYDEEIEKLYLLGLIPSLSSFCTSQSWWHDRVETLSGLCIPFSTEVDWKQTYRIVCDEFEANLSFFNAEDNVTVCEILLRLGRIPTTCDLAAAAKHGTINVLQWLLAEGRAHPGSLPVRGTYPLSYAAKEGHYEAVQLLLADKRVDPSYTYGYNNALTLACEVRRRDRVSSYVKIVQLLLADRRIDPSWSWSKCLHVTKCADIEIFELLLVDGRADPGDSDSEVLIRAASSGSAEVVARLLQDSRIHPNSQEGSSLRLASLNGHTEVVRVLLTDGRVDPTLRHNTILAGAPAQDNEGILKLLLSDERVLASIRSLDEEKMGR